MRFKTPVFWYRNPDSATPLFEILLQPFSWLYQLGTVLHKNIKNPVQVNVPVLCVGNIVAGGAGKTVTAQALMTLIQKYDLSTSPAFLTRGYGGVNQGPFIVDPNKHSHIECGDEALLLARQAQTIVSKNRVRGADFATENGARLLILDDGMQNRALQKDLIIAVISGDMGFGNGRLLPAGPLRQSLKSGFEQADAFVLIGEDKHGVAKTLPPDKPLWRASFTTDQESLPPKDACYVAFAGIGYPTKFFSYLKNDLGYEVVEEIGFADHRPYTAQDLKNLEALAQNRQAELITTEKDYVRLPSGHKLKIHTLPVTLSWTDEGKVVEFLKTHLGGASS